MIYMQDKNPTSIADGSGCCNGLGVLQKLDRVPLLQELEHCRHFLYQAELQQTLNVRILGNRIGTD